MLRRRPRSTANHRPRVNRNAKMGADRRLASRQTLIVEFAASQIKSELLISRVGFTATKPIVRLLPLSLHHPTPLTSGIALPKE
jgi:hypothetical protein